MLETRHLSPFMVTLEFILLGAIIANYFLIESLVTDELTLMIVN